MYTLGIDVGSTTSKCVILEDGERVVGKSIVIAGTGTTGPNLALKEIYEATGLKEEDIQSVIATGYGRKLLEGVRGEISELSCHAKGSFFLFPDVRTIVDIGGQDAKVIAITDKGKIKEFLMNDKCAAGTGRFLDVMANILQLDINELEVEAKKAKAPVKISNTCTVFAESEVISQLAMGVDTPNIVAGICNSVAGRVGSLAKRIGIKEQVCMSGGVAQNGGVREALARELGCEILYSPMAQFAGALGAAIYAYEKEKEREDE